jgi:hypothetical protein
MCDYYRVCALPDFATHFRVQGDIAALRAATVTACRNGRCYSASLAYGVDELVAGPATGLLTVGFPEASLHPPGPTFKLTIRLRLLVTSSCTPWCDATLEYRHQQGESVANGDRYEVYLSRSGPRIRDTARYEIVEQFPADRCEPGLTCARCTPSHDGEPPLRVR